MANDIMDNFQIFDDENLDDILPIGETPVPNQINIPSNVDNSSSNQDSLRQDKSVKKSIKKDATLSRSDLARFQFVVPVVLKDALRYLCISNRTNLTKLFLDSVWQVYGPEIKKRYPDLYEQVKVSLSR